MATEKVNALIEEIKAMSVLELSELVHEIEDVFGVSAAAAVAFDVHSVAGALTAMERAPGLESQDSYESRLGSVTNSLS